MATTFPDRASTDVWHEEMLHLTPKVGDEAPDFELFGIDGRDSVRLSNFRGEKPVALVFGSFT